MFYSQFILAKKGPLGTIWIAAHLERKLRKNQVADTDIGVSVDSILFPEVPIALRLSSHLLLGVVRIYSRKVNYLFDDCSEALLKVKQAFRSTAVDLPPEESTAPYHSITLPETFDLDDFELPDNDIFQGNYVDHHVSTREQITLQDTMDGVVYSTSQFGLDERFGDGDASQIGLDLDEELLLDKVTAPEHGGISNADPQGSVKPMTPWEEDGNSERINETSEAMAVNNSANQLERLGAEFVEYAEAPSTPGLAQEPNLSCVQEALACDDHMESEDHNSDELVARVSTVKALRKSDFHHGDDNAMDCSSHNDSNHDSVQGMLPEENGYHVREKEVKQAKLHGDSVNSTPFVSDYSEGTIGTLDGSDRLENIQNAVVSENVPSMLSVETKGVRSDTTAASPSCSHVASVTQDPSHKTDITNEPVSEGFSVDDRASTRIKIGSDAEISDNLLQSNLPAIVDVEGHASQEHQDPMTSYVPNVHEEMPSNVTNVPCSSHLSQPDISSPGQENVMALNLQSEEVGLHSLETSQIHGASIEVQGEDCHVTDIMQSDKNQISGPSLCGEIHADSKKSDELLDNAISTDQLEHVNDSMSSELLAPEKLLSVPDVVLDKPNDFLVDSTPDKEILSGNGGVDAGNKHISGKKRSYTESTLTVESLNSSESFGVAKSKKASASIPDDDDLLSSILVGRRSSVLKLKPTPLPPEVASRKRTRTASQASALKRKVLMDDTMVLHGDIIRQQLTNTEDIRRIRKKAPCTCPEILMIQIQFLEDEIFTESIFTGMSAELMSLHCETHDLSRIRVSETDENYGSPEIAKFTEESGKEGSKEPVVLENSGEAQPASSPIQTESWQGSEHLLGRHETDAQGCANPISDVAELETMHNDPLTKVAEVGVDGGNIEVAKDKTDGADASLQMEASSLTLEQKLDAQPIEEVASLTDISNGKQVDDESELNAQDELLLEEGKVGASVKNRADVQTDCTAPTENPNTFKASSLETGGNLASENGDRSNLGAVNEDGFLSVSLGCDGYDNSISNHVSGEESIIYSTNSVEHDEGLKNASLNGGENPIFINVDLQCTTDAEIMSFDHPAAENRGEFEDMTVGNDTEFLNVDDDEVAEDYNDGNGGAEDTRLLDNSGWSSRTRAVAKYLQTLFDRGTVHGKKVLALDYLLSGKTRKEASRMFFETLVLKTKDYIHVEQAKPLDNISIKPRAKLIKSDF